MSVIVKDKQGNHEYFLKGSPEKVATLCTNLPADYKEHIHKLSTQGLRVLALAGKKLDVSKDQDVKTFKREDLEAGLEFYGLLILGGKLKRATIPTLRILKEANIQSVMATGDNLETAISIGRKCGIVEREVTKIESSDDILALKEWESNEFAMTADTFNTLLENHKELLKKIIFKVKVVARMKPDNKEDLVHLL